MVFVRYVLNQNTIWQTDFITYSLVAATFIGSPYLLLTRGHVNVDVLPLYLGPRARSGSRWYRSLMSLGFCVVMTVLTFSSGLRRGTNAGCRTPCGARGCGFPTRDADRARPAHAAIRRRFISLVTGREPPFGSTEGNRRRRARAQPAGGRFS